MMIARHDYQVASDLIREVGTAENWRLSQGLRSAVLRLATLWGGFNALFSGVGVALGPVPINA